MEKKSYHGYGPATADGFYFDFELKDGEINETDFEKIEAKMEEIKAEKQIISRKEISLEQAKELFKDNSYKMEWLDQIKEAEKKSLFTNTQINLLIYVKVLMLTIPQR
jgi:threonyl-tRNA synthetase